MSPLYFYTTPLYFKYSSTVYFFLFTYIYLIPLRSTCICSISPLSMIFSSFCESSRLLSSMTPWTGLPGTLRKFSRASSVSDLLPRDDDDDDRCSALATSCKLNFALLRTTRTMSRSSSRSRWPDDAMTHQLFRAGPKRLAVVVQWNTDIYNLHHWIFASEGFKQQNLMVKFYVSYTTKVLLIFASDGLLLQICWDQSIRIPLYYYQSGRGDSIIIVAFFLGRRIRSHWYAML